MSTDRGVPRWQLSLAVIGFLLWLGLLSSAEFIKAQGWSSFYRFVAGYSLGYVIAFTGFVFWEFAQGRGRHLLDPHPFFRWFSYLSLAVLMLVGLVSLAAEIFGNTDWRYNIGSLLAGIAVGIGLLPVIEKYDRH